MEIQADSFPQVLIVFVLWTAATISIARLQTGNNDKTLTELVTRVPLWSVFVAMLIAVGAVALWQVWQETGFRAVVAGAPWELLIIPVVFVLFLLARGIIFRPSFSRRVMVLVLINTFMVGISEETMFRGLLLSGLFSQFDYWPAILITSALFGAVHVLNGFITGKFGEGVLQAFMATMSGLLFMAIRIGMGSIFPAIILHWLWDFAVFVNTSQDTLQADESPKSRVFAVIVLLAPLIFAGLGIVVLFRYVPV